MCYSIRIQKTVGGEVEKLPLVTVESETLARVKVDEYTEFYEDVLNGEAMRMVGAEIDVICERCASITGLGESEIIDWVTIKRPLHSPSARVCRRNG